MAVIGAGAAGLMAAVAARRAGAAVTGLEKNRRVGKKILATGNGRCNLTNKDLDIARFHGMSPRFAHGVLARFDQHRTIAFFEQLGVPLKLEPGGRVFPASNRASSIAAAFRRELARSAVDVVLGFDVVLAERRGEVFLLHAGNGRRREADRVIIATGGRASPQFGSTGDGYRLAEALGHRIVTPFPSLVQLRLKHNIFKPLRGVKFDGAVEIIVDGKPRDRAAGEILFTDFGVSGPAVFDVSRTAGAYLQQGQTVWIRLTLVNNRSREELERLLLRRFAAGPRKSLPAGLTGILSRRLAPVVLREAGLEDQKRAVSTLTAEERRRLLDVLQDWRFEVAGPGSWAFAQVTAGGVDVRDIHPGTMESKLVPGLYFAGEVVDIDGDCGGFNLQWAWSSGWVAGRSAAGAPD